MPINRAKGAGFCFNLQYRFPNPNNPMETRILAITKAVWERGIDGIEGKSTLSLLVLTYLCASKKRSLC
jgi:hypothetical protein